MDRRQCLRTAIALAGTALLPQLLMANDQEASASLWDAQYHRFFAQIPLFYRTAAGVFFLRWRTASETGQRDGMETPSGKSR